MSNNNNNNNNNFNHHHGNGNGPPRPLPPTMVAGILVPSPDDPPEVHELYRKVRKGQSDLDKGQSDLNIIRSKIGTETPEEVLRTIEKLFPGEDGKTTTTTSNNNNNSSSSSSSSSNNDDEFYDEFNTYWKHNETAILNHQQARAQHNMRLLATQQGLDPTIVDRAFNSPGYNFNDYDFSNNNNNNNDPPAPQFQWSKVVVPSNVSSSSTARMMVGKNVQVSDTSITVFTNAKDATTGNVVKFQMYGDAWLEHLQQVLPTTSTTTTITTTKKYRIGMTGMILYPRGQQQQQTVYIELPTTSEQTQTPLWGMTRFADPNNSRQGVIQMKFPPASTTARTTTTTNNNNISMVQLSVPLRTQEGINRANIMLEALQSLASGN